MSRIRCCVIVCAALLAAAGARDGTCLAQPVAPAPAPTSAPMGTGTARVAIANPATIFNNMLETRNLQAQMRQQQQVFEQAQRAKVAEIEEIKNRRDGLDPNAQQWVDQNGELSKKVSEYKIWAETQKVMAESEQKVRMRQLFKKIEDTVAEVAKRDRLDLVISDNREALPNNLDDIDVRAFRAMLLSRDVLFSASQVDITQTVLTLLDARFRGLSH